MTTINNTHISPMTEHVPATKAYKNSKFLSSTEGRNIRILCEHQETETRLRHNNLKATILVFGSARSKSHTEYARIKADLEAAIAKDSSDYRAKDNLKRLEDGSWMCEVYDKITDLSKRMTEWSKKYSLGSGRDLTGVSRSKSQSSVGSAEEEIVGRKRSLSTDNEQSLVVTTGGGPGFMEAANKGGAEAAGGTGKTMGMGISLPFEKGLNKYVTPELAFEFHYFFTRKFWMVYHCQGLICAPGGVGTFDELFEVLTLKQTGKVAKDLPVVLFGKSFWNTVINWESLVNFGVVSRKDVDDLFITDDVTEAFNYLTDRLITNANFDMQGVTHNA